MFYKESMSITHTSELGESFSYHIFLIKVSWEIELFDAFGMLPLFTFSDSLLVLPKKHRLDGKHKGHGLFSNRAVIE